MAADQRYCLSCGTRRGSRSPGLERILAGLQARSPQAAAVASSSSSSSSSPGRGVLPGPFAAAALILAMLGFGTIAGGVAGSPAGQLDALRRGPLTLLIPANTPTPATLPPTESAPTPEPAAAPPASEAGTGEPSEPTPSSGGGHKKSGGHSGGPKGGKSSTLPPVKHVFLIVLADQPYAQTFGPESPAPYLAQTLERRGELLVRFYGVAREELANEVALISGLGPTPQTVADCPTFTDIVPTTPNKEGQYGGEGCIYPSAAQTVGDQLAAKKLTWRVYAEGMNEGGSPTCRHPAFGAADPTTLLPPGGKFATFRDPFTYFDSVIDSPACAHEDVGLEKLAGDLKSAKNTPALSYIVPGLCDDGRPTQCAPGAQSGLPAADAFLHRVVPEILASPAYRHGGLLIITTDQAPATGVYADSSACCLQPRFPAPQVAQPPAGAQPGGAPSSTATTTTSTTTAPATPTSPATTTPTVTTPATSTPETGAPATTTPSAGAPTTTTPSTTTTTPGTTTPGTTTPGTITPGATTPAIQLPPSGGGQVGALLLSPYVKPGTANQEPFNDFSLLRTIENLFGLPHLGYAAKSGAGAFEASVFSAYGGG
jgi:phosphatidylinositol-3-phosphatase